MEKNEEKNFANDTTSLAQIRTKLANERTFLSWIRTGLSCVGGGIAIIKFINFQNATHRLAAQISGDVLIFTGVLFFLFALVSYRNVKQALPDITGFKETSTVVMTATMIVLTVLSFVFLFII